MLLNKVHEAENIEVSEDEIKAEIDRMVEEAGEEQGEMVRKMFESPEAHESISGRILTEKTLNLLIDIATSGDGATAETAEPEEEENQSTDESGSDVEGSSDKVVQAEDQDKQSTSEEDSE